MYRGTLGKTHHGETSLCGPFRHHFQSDVGDKYILANVWIFPRGRIFMLIKIMTLRWGHTMRLTLINSTAVINTLCDTTVETDFKNQFYANSS